MYNDKNPLSSQSVSRDMHSRVPVGRSCPNFAGRNNETADLPMLDQRQGRRLCDGSLPEDSRPFGGKMTQRNENGGSCQGGCGEYDGGWGLSSYPLAMVYSPLQKFHELYEIDVALSRGTLFSELDLPFEGGKMNKGGCKLC